MSCRAVPWAQLLQRPGPTFLHCICPILQSQATTSERNETLTAKPTVGQKLTDMKQKQDSAILMESLQLKVLNKCWIFHLHMQVEPCYLNLILRHALKGPQWLVGIVDNVDTENADGIFFIFIFTFSLYALNSGTPPLLNGWVLLLIVYMAHLYPRENFTTGTFYTTQPLKPWNSPLKLGYSTHPWSICFWNITSPSNPCILLTQTISLPFTLQALLSWNTEWIRIFETTWHADWKW